MIPQEIQPGKIVRTVVDHRSDLESEALVIVRFPVRGLYHDYVLCRKGEDTFYFLPAELKPADDPKS